MIRALLSVICAAVLLLTPQTVNCLEIKAKPGDFIIAESGGVKSAPLKVVGAAPPEILFNYRKDPSLAVAGEKVQWAFTVTSSTGAALKSVSVDIFFSGEGHFLEKESSLCSAIKPTQAQISSTEYPVEPDAYGYRCSLANLDSNEMRPFWFYQEEAVEGTTMVSVTATHADSNEEYWDPSPPPIEVLPPSPALSIDIPLRKQALQTGIRAETLISVTNTGNGRILEPTLSVEMAGSAVPQEFDDEGTELPDPLPMNIRAEFVEQLEPGADPNDPDNYYGTGETLYRLFEWGEGTLKGEGPIVDPSGFSAGPAYLEPGETAQVKISFTPKQAGDLSLSAHAFGRNYRGAPLKDDIETSVKVEGPILALDLIGTTPEASGYTEEDQTPYYAGDEITLRYRLQNNASSALFENGKIYFPGLRKDVASSMSVKSGNPGIRCGRESDNFGRMVCLVEKLEPGKELLFDVSLKNATPLDMDVTVLGLGTNISYPYRIAAMVETKISEDIWPIPHENGLTPNDPVRAHFIIENNGNQLRGAELIVSPKISGETNPLQSDQTVGCDGAVTLSPDGYSCKLSAIDINTPADIRLSFVGAGQSDLDKDFTLNWKLKIPDSYSISEKSETSGRVMYNIMERFTDVWVDGSDDLIDAIPGKPYVVLVQVGNDGSWPQERVFLELKFDVMTGDGSATSLPNKIPAPNGANGWLQSVELLVPEGLIGQPTPCFRSGPGDQFVCEIERVDPGDTHTVKFVWTPNQSAAGANFSYQAKVSTSSGTKENTMLATKNTHRASGKVVRVQNPEGSWDGGEVLGTTDIKDSQGNGVIAKYSSGRGKIYGEIRGHTLTGHWVEQESKTPCDKQIEKPDWYVSIYDVYVAKLGQSWGDVVIEFNDDFSKFVGRRSRCGGTEYTTWEGRKQPDADKY